MDDVFTSIYEHKDVGVAFLLEEDDEYAEDEEDDEDDEDDEVNVVVVANKKELKQIDDYDRHPIYSFSYDKNPETILSEIYQMLSKDDILLEQEDLIYKSVSDKDYQIDCNYFSSFTDSIIFQFKVKIFQDNSNRRVVVFERTSGYFYCFLSFYNKCRGYLNIK
jgi:hypothetical protein